jgi:choline dehydrogenase-like flavoprotein
MLSGIGSAEQLDRHGIAVRTDLPGVGENLQDHHEVPVVAATNGACGHFGEDCGWRMLRNGLAYLLFRSARITTTSIESCAFIDPDGRGDETIQLWRRPSWIAASSIQTTCTSSSWARASREQSS